MKRRRRSCLAGSGMALKVALAVFTASITYPSRKPSDISTSPAPFCAASVAVRSMVAQLAALSHSTGMKLAEATSTEPTEPTDSRCFSRRTCRWVEG